jgi:hypothetical protein
MLLIVGLGLTINSVWSHSSVLDAQSDFSNTTLLSVTNAQRTTDHEASLSLDQQLTTAAQAKAEDMVKANYWAHNSPDGKTPWSFITTSGYQYQAAGENLAYGFSSATDTVTGWMNSPEHRANILNTTYENVGFGIASSPNYQNQGPETIVVAEYAQPVTTATKGAKPIATNRLLNSSSTTAGTVQGATTELAAQPVSRIQLLTGGQAAWSLAVVSALTGAALALFIVRHSLRFRRLALQGESFISHHPFLDIAMTFIFTAGFVLTQSGGIIR